MSTLDVHSETDVDWDEWDTPLRQFSSASGFVLSVYDTAGARRLGPIVHSRTARLLATSTLWDEAGPGTALERAMVREVAASGAGAQARFGDGLRVCGMPLVRFDQVYGVLIYGWTFRDFSSPLECEQLGRLVGLSGHVLWADVRLEPPVADARLATYAALLGTLVGSIDRQRETIEELNRVSRARDLFLATVSHEMRTPLSALSMRLELMLRTVANLPAAVEAGLVSMRKHVRQEANMIDDLIDAARTLTGQMSVVKTKVSVGQVLHDAISTIEVSAHDKQIVIQVTPADFGEFIMVSADPRRLQQVMWNLLFNAVKFTPVGGAIRVDVRQDAHATEIEIADTGQGIEAAQMAQVFAAFKLQRHANPSGLGLGLYIARHLVELHGGTLTVASAGKRQGTTFKISLPTG
ncbi:MAG: HAMP domain-containing sensor histidine kinase [Massilia sp.]